MLARELQLDFSKMPIYMKVPQRQDPGQAFAQLLHPGCKVLEGVGTEWGHKAGVQGPPQAMVFHRESKLLWVTPPSVLESARAVVVVYMLRLWAADSM